MRASDISQMRSVEKVTIVAGLALLVIAFWFPHSLLVHDGGIVLAGMTIMIGRRVSNQITVGLSLVTVAAFIASGILRHNNRQLGEVLYFVGVGLACCVALAYGWVYRAQRS
jgi:hypothetical protein